MKQILRALVASSLAAAGLSVAFAQSPAPSGGPMNSGPMMQGPMMQGPMMQGQRMQPGMGEGMRGPRSAMSPVDRAEARLAYIRTALKITPAQEPQWNAYAGFVRKTSAEMQQRFEQRRQQFQQQGPQAGGPRGPQAGPQGQQAAPQGPQAGPHFQRPNAVESIERRQAMHTEASRRLAELLAVQKPLYDVLSPEQQQVADEVLRPRRFASREGRGMHRG